MRGVMRNYYHSNYLNSLESRDEKENEAICFHVKNISTLSSVVFASHNESIYLSVYVYDIQSNSQLYYLQ